MDQKPHRHYSYAQSQQLKREEEERQRNQTEFFTNFIHQYKADHPELFNQSKDEHECLLGVCPRTSFV